MGFLSPNSGTLVYTKVLTADTATIDTGATIPAGGNVLSVYAALRTDQAVVLSTGAITFNNDSAAHYDSVDMQVLNASVAGANSLAQTALTFDVAGASAAAGVVSLLELSVPAYALTTFNPVGAYRTTIPSQTAASALFQSRGFGWRNLAAINQLTLAITSGVTQKFKAGSVIYVYVS